VCVCVCVCTWRAQARVAAALHSCKRCSRLGLGQGWSMLIEPLVEETFLLGWRPQQQQMTATADAWLGGWWRCGISAEASARCSASTQPPSPAVLTHLHGDNGLLGRVEAPNLPRSLRHLLCGTRREREGSVGLASDKREKEEKRKSDASVFVRACLCACMKVTLNHTQTHFARSQ
jgi:hypothetical protein